MEKKDSAPPSPSRSPAGGSPTAHSAGQASPSSPNTRSPAFPPGRELFSPYPYHFTRSRAASSRQGPGDDDSPRNPDRPVKLRSLKDVYASTDPIEESSDAKVPRRLGCQSPREAKSSGADFHSPGPLTSVSSLGSQEKKSSAPSQHYQEIKDTVLADHLMQEMATVEDQTSLGTGSGAPVGSQPGPSGPSPPKGPMGPDPGPQAPGSPSESSEKPVIVVALLAHEGRGGSDDPVGLGGPVGSPSGPGEPSQDMTTETSGDHPGSGSGSQLSDEPNV